MSSPNKTLGLNVPFLRILLILTYGQLHCVLAVDTTSLPRSRVNLHTRHPGVLIFLFMASLPSGLENAWLLLV